MRSREFLFLGTQIYLRLEASKLGEFTITNRNLLID